MFDMSTNEIERKILLAEYFSLQRVCPVKTISNLNKTKTESVLVEMVFRFFLFVTVLFTFLMFQDWETKHIIY